MYLLIIITLYMNIRSTALCTL